MTRISPKQIEKLPEALKDIEDLKVAKGINIESLSSSDIDSIFVG